MNHETGSLLKGPESVAEEKRRKEEKKEEKNNNNDTSQCRGGKEKRQVNIFPCLVRGEKENGEWPLNDEM